MLHEEKVGRVTYFFMIMEVDHTYGRSARPVRYSFHARQPFNFHVHHIAYACHNGSSIPRLVCSTIAPDQRLATAS